jgi:anti-sigma regulatory factor (Ser/Thr protein kinase)
MQLDTEIRLRAGDHVVQFYADDDDLASVVVGHFATALIEGDAVIIIATPEHREVFLAGLRSTGTDVDGAQANGLLLVFDAAETLARFVVDGILDRGAFDAVVGSVVRHAASCGRVVRAYGEMVALLWEAGNVVEAIELERLWNHLAEEVPLSLLCGYPCQAMEEPGAISAFAEVCEVHSDVVAGAPTPEGAEISRRFPGAARAPGHARQFVAEVLRTWARSDLTDQAMLVVSELATNAVMHARSGFTVSLARADGVLRVAVGDTDPAMPAPRAASSTAVGGRGLQVVEALSSRWGYSAVPGGKVVWADLSGCHEDAA